MPKLATVFGGTAAVSVVAAVGLPGLIFAIAGVVVVAVGMCWVLRPTASDRGCQPGSAIGGLSAATTHAVACPLGWSALCHGVMSAGMGIALLAMT